MKKIVASILLSSLLLSCGEPRGKKAPDSKRIELDSTSQYYDQNYKIYTLEGCEYVSVGSGSNRWGAHKGNCKNHTYYKSDSIQILKEEIDRIKKYIIQLEEENKMMGSELGWREFNKK
jgi:hypothetical protein